MVNRETGGAQSTLSVVTGFWILTLEPARRKNRKAITGLMNPVRKKFSSQRSSCLYLQMFRIETHSFLPNQQSDRSNLARQSKPCHVRLHSPRHASFVEILKRSAVGCRPSGRALEDVFQIMIVVAVQSADGRDFLGTLELSALETIFTAGVGL
jgi:hypothetical protein